jgi:DNA-binding transcriptional LysR family regulator
MDVCFTFGEAPSDPELQSEPVAREDFVIIAPLGHRLAGRTAIDPEELADEAFLVTERGCVYRHLFESAFPAVSSNRPRVAGEFSSIAAIRSLVETGLGCALVPRLVALSTDGRIVALPWIGGADSVPISMIWRRRRVQSPGLHLFLEAARDSFGPLRSGDVRPRHAVPFP